MSSEILTLPTDHLSPSQVSMYLRCPAQYEARYVRGERRPPGLALLRGSGVHSGAEHRNRLVMESQEEPPRGDVVDVAVEAFDRRVNEEGEIALNDDEAAAGRDAAIGASRDATARLAGCFVDEVAPEIRHIVAVEEHVDIEIPRLGVSLVAILDVAHVPAAEHAEAFSGVVVEDFKTGAKKRSQADVDGDRQLTWQAMGWRHLRGELPTRVGLRMLLDYKKGPATAWLGTDRTADDIAALTRTITAVARSISAGVFPPAPDGSWWCSRRFCGWYETCPYVNAKGRTT